MKLFVWREVFCTNYSGCGMIMALAQSEDEAREIIRREDERLADEIQEGKLTVYDNPTVIFFEPDNN